MNKLVVGRTTARFVRKGHPWIRFDRYIQGLKNLGLGEAVTVVDEHGQALGSAIVDPNDELCARMYHQRPDRAFDAAAAIQRAWDRRSHLHDDPDTTCYRVVHGEGDYLPGLRVERYGDVLVVLLRSPAIAAHTDAICTALTHCMPHARLVTRRQFDDLRSEKVSTSAWPNGQLDRDEMIEAQELGVTMALQPFVDLATGIYVDQRATRLWLRQDCSGKRVANLFAYTGLFSLSLLTAGASEAIDVDLAAPALALGQHNAELNGLADRYQQHRGDVREWLEKGSDQFDIIICDPPTAAQGAGGWIARRDYPRVLTAIDKRLAPGGLLVAITNTLGKPYDLKKAVTSALPNLKLIDNPSLGDDLPQLRGFPEGRPFRIVAGRKSK